MTNTPDELQRVWRVVEAIPAINDLSAQYQNDIAEALLSERAELLATVERMRGEMAGMETRLRRWEPRVSLDLWVASGRPFGAALSTGEEK